MELTRTLEQRNLISHRHNRLKLSLKEAAYALHQAKMPVRQKRATSLFRRHLFISGSPPGVPTFGSDLGPGTRRRALEDLLALGMKNYKARRSRSCSQRGQLTCVVAMPFAETFPIRMLLDNGVNSLSSYADMAPVIIES